MSNGRAGAPVVAFVVVVVTVVAFSGRLEATHFSWLGHASCPGGEARCDTHVPAGFTALGQFEHGFYNILDETAPEWQTESRDEALLTRDGKLIANVGHQFRQQLDTEGSARLRNGTIVNVETKTDGAWRYLVLKDAPFGIGAPGYKLMPYRTVSVNPKRIRIGTVLYLPSLAAVPLPGGEVHDGFVFAHDMHDGEGIDIFAGFDRNPDKVLGRIKTRRTLPVYQVDAETGAVLNRRFKNQFDWSG